MRPYRVKDFEFSVDGDFVIGEDGDISTTDPKRSTSFVQELRTRARSSVQDWEMHPNLGASLFDLIGEPNDKTIAEEGAARIKAALVRDGFIDSSLVRVRYMPVDQNSILYNILVDLPDLADNDTLSFSLVFDTNQQDVKFI
jgi:hypothetical protein